MNLGTWTLLGFGASASLAAASHATGVARPLRPWAGAAAALLGSVLATYTGVLVGQTSIPAWERARTRLPFAFASAAAAAAAGLACLLMPPREAGPARLLAVGGGLAEVASSRLMERALGDHARVYREGAAGRYRRLSEGLTLAGVAAVAAFGRRRRWAALGGAALLASSLCQRLAVWRAGRQSAGLTGMAPDSGVSG